ncbi:MAG: hypothetical protein GWN01_11800, partial [Nitrosopumilaceae archaeon]|nr:hypothetical protein [Nitrosopumilaceae archaeon]NIU01559.1 hypothetical protein [Nitrosopumilaceae archaeon]NIU87978.1 hypothetical protein [Nitrosopumilaceae archaeon]NIV65310.1 hypothetical protein [Nitrosopumilaceae archaeon]NIX62161.1 hypothetical protein [Nitrosopumilaceae archaeon]
MKRKILGVTLGAVFVLAMMTNPVFASSPDLTVTSVNAEDGTLTMTVQGTA